MSRDASERGDAMGDASFSKYESQKRLTGILYMIHAWM